MALSDSTNFRFVEQFVRGTSPNELPEELVARLVYESLAAPAKVWRREWFSGLLQAERSDASVDRQVSVSRQSPMSYQGVAAVPSCEAGKLTRPPPRRRHERTHADVDRGT